MIQKSLKMLCIILCLCSLATAATASEICQADHTPWSGYWWPYTEGGLATGNDYLGSPAPLEKYQMIQDGETSGDAMDWYLERYYNTEAPDWHGLCGFWARAACYEHIDFYPSVENNIVFRVGDKKGLVTLCHNADLSEREDGSEPEVFHRWLLTYIKEAGEAFMFDLDPSEEGWSYALYRYDMSISSFTGGESVTVTIYYADDFVDPDYMGTQTKFNTYTYDLYLDGDGNITDGEWTGDSVEDHPDGLTYPLMMVNNCTGLDYDEVLRLAQETDDELENGTEAVAIGPGTYNLVLMDEDAYRIDASQGDVIQLSLEKQTGSQYAIAVEILDDQGNLVAMADVSLKNPLSTTLTADSTGYYVTLTQSDYTDPNIYTIVIDQQKSYSQSLPYLPKNGYWSGFSLTNDGDDTAENVTLSAYSGEGEPLQTLYGPVALEAGEKQLFLFEDLPWRLHEYDDIDHMVVSAGDDIGYLNMAGTNATEVAASQVQGASMGGHLVFPETSSSFSTGKSVKSSLVNPNFDDITATLNLYNASGQEINTTETALGAREKISMKAGSAPFTSMPSDGWVEVQVDDDAEIVGYQQLSGDGSFEGLFAIPVLDGTETKYIPHVPPVGGNWYCRTVLINPNDDYNTIRLHPAKAGSDTDSDLVVTLEPFEKRTLSLTSKFGAVSGDPLYRSILEVSGTLPLAGYYAYQPVENTDVAYYPLINADELKEAVVLSHNAGKGGYWWTAACVFNPGTSAVDVEMAPYDDDGALMTEKVSTLEIPAGGYQIIQTRAFFGKQTAAQISFLKFTGPSGAGLGGFIMYGTTAYGMVTGHNM